MDERCEWCDKVDDWHGMEHEFQAWKGSKAVCEWWKDDELEEYTGNPIEREHKAYAR